MRQRPVVLAVRFTFHRRRRTETEIIVTDVIDGKFTFARLQQNQSVFTRSFTNIGQYEIRVHMRAYWRRLNQSFLPYAKRIPDAHCAGVNMKPIQLVAHGPQRWRDAIYDG